MSVFPCTHCNVVFISSNDLEPEKLDFIWCPFPVSQVKLLGIDASGIADGVPSVILNLVWNIILHFQVGASIMMHHSTVLMYNLTSPWCLSLPLTLHTISSFAVLQVKEVTRCLQRHISYGLSSLSMSSYPSPSDLLPQSIGNFSCNTMPSKGRKSARRKPKYQGKVIKTLLLWVQRCTSK